MRNRWPESERDGLGVARSSPMRAGVSGPNRSRVVGHPSATKGQPKAESLKSGEAAGWPFVAPSFALMWRARRWGVQFDVGKVYLLKKQRVRNREAAPSLYFILARRSSPCFGWPVGSFPPLDRPSKKHANTARLLLNSLSMVGLWVHEYGGQPIHQSRD